jgi:SAM-dependent methyltransferase
MSSIFDDAYAGSYDLLYKDKNYAAEAASVAKYFKRHGIESGALLELGSGTGRHAIEFARLGYDVLGVERSDAMLRRAKSKRFENAIGRLEFESGDVRSYRSGRIFDAVVSLFHVLSYQTTNEDLIATFETAAHHLRRGGLFVFDCWYGPAVLSERPSARIKRIEDENVTIIRVAEPALDVRRNVAVIDYTILIERNGRDLQHWHETHRMRYLFEPEVSELLKRTGLELCDAHESVTGRALGADTWSAMFVAKKRW